MRPQPRNIGLSLDFRLIRLHPAAVAIYVVYNNYDEMVMATGYPARGDSLRYADESRLRKHYEYTFDRISSPFQTFETDMLIIGSGAGGGVVASQLAQKGWNVFVVDKGIYVKPEDMLGTESDGFGRLYENGGLMSTEDASMTILAGSTFGGGTTSTSFRSIPDFCRETDVNAHSQLVGILAAAALPAGAVGEGSRVAVLPLEGIRRVDRSGLRAHGRLRRAL